MDEPKGGTSTGGWGVEGLQREALVVNRTIGAPICNASYRVTQHLQCIYLLQGIAL